MIWEKYTVLQRKREKGQAIIAHAQERMCRRVWLDLMALKKSQLEIGLEW